MPTTADMLAARPDKVLVDLDALRECIDACCACAQICQTCADACLGEADVASLRHCIRLDLDCADLCGVTARALSRWTNARETLLRELIEVCRDACLACAAECDSHGRAGMEHCRLCAEACAACARACDRMLGAVTAT